MYTKYENICIRDFTIIRPFVFSLPNSLSACMAWSNILVPDWKRFLDVDVNKQALLVFLGEYTTRYYSELGDMPYPGDILYIAGLFTDPNVAFYGLFFIEPVVDINNCTSF
jgi:hypothetical protein